MIRHGSMVLPLVQLECVVGFTVRSGNLWCCLSMKIMSGYQERSVSDRQTSFIENSIEAGILRGGKGAIHASVGLCLIVTCGTKLECSCASSLHMQLSRILSISLISLAISRLFREFV